MAKNGADNNGDGEDKPYPPLARETVLKLTSYIMYIIPDDM